MSDVDRTPAGVTKAEEFEGVFQAAYESQNVSWLGALYEEDAILIQPGLDYSIIGRSAIEEAMAETFSFLSDIKLTFHEPAMFRVEGDLAWCHGSSTTNFSLPDGSHHSAYSRSTTVLHRGSDGYWRLVLDHAT